MDKKTLAVLAAALFGLAACGSGSKGHSGMINTGGSTAANTPAPAGPTLIGSNQEDAEKGRAGKVLVFTPADSDIPPDEGSFNVKEDLTRLNVNNYSIPLLPQGHEKDTVYKENVPLGKVFRFSARAPGSQPGNEQNAPYLGSGNSPYKEHLSWTWFDNSLPDVKHGDVHDDGQRRYTFVQGNLTPAAEMPDGKGDHKITYRGKGTHHFHEMGLREVTKPDGSKETKKFVNRSAFMEADVEMLVNFGHNSIVGKITPKPTAAQSEITAEAMKKLTDRQPWQGGVQPVIVRATIEENKFKGTNYDTNTEVEGAFYGKNADQMGGVYNRKEIDDETKWNEYNYPTEGSFGAKCVENCNKK